MILIRTQIQATSSKLQAASFIVDIEPYIWDNMITFNKRITHDKIKKRPDNRTDTHSIRPEGSAGRTRSFETQAQEPARLRFWDGAAAARAGRSVGRRSGMQHQLARSLKLRDLHAAVPGSDGRDASSEVINRGLRAPTPYTINAQALKRQGASTQAAGAQAPRGSRAQGRRRASRGSQAPGPWPLDKVSGSAARGSRLR